jgi:Cd2+/Zn2+-exporting ATPase/Cu+-exporting ATPase
MGKAILKRAAAAGLPVIEPERFAYTPGKGVVCMAGGEEIVVGSRAFLTERDIDVTPCAFSDNEGGEVHVARGRRSLGDLHVADVLRPEARDAVATLRQMGLRVILLTGDNQAVASAVGRQLGIDEVEAGLLPTGKLARIDALLARRNTVAMVGDGINDAPALMRASVGVAMGSGTDVARESAPVVLLGNDLRTVAETLRTARRCRRIITTNFVGTLLVDCVGVALAALGLLAPLLAAFVHVASEFAFILNSARLLPTACVQASRVYESSFPAFGCGKRRAGLPPDGRLLAQGGAWRGTSLEIRK